MDSEKQPMKINAETGITIPLSNLIMIIAAAATAVLGYTDIDSRLSALDRSITTLERTTDDHKKWIHDWETGGLLPIDQIQNLKIEQLENFYQKYINEH